MSKPQSPPPASSLSVPNPGTDDTVPAPLLAIERQWAPAFVDRLLRELPPIRDQRIRALALGERLSTLNADDIIAIAQRLHDAVLLGDEAALEVVGCFRDAAALESKLGAARMTSLAAAAWDAGDDLTHALITPSQVSEEGGNRTHRDLRDISLGQRKALARGHRKDMLVKLLEDDHPHVQENLLSNPRLTAREVVTVAAKRPGHAHVLRGIARHPRWMHNYEVRRALAKNPDTPLDVAGRIVISLPKSDLTEIHTNTKLHVTLRQLADQRLDRLRAAEITLTLNEEEEEEAL